jgi:SSS family solute:Na+ symporter
MDFTLLDWSLVFAVIIFSVGVALYSQRQTKSVADFLVANRTGGRYMLTMAEGMAGFGAISMIAYFQAGIKVGFGAGWWGQFLMPLAMLATMCGFITYRYRETRVMTLGQMLELRYSKNFRKTAGIVMWTSGILNFGIFPAVGANFFVTFCGLPEHYSIAGISISTYHTLLAFLILLSYYMVFAGGQISVMSLDFLQMLFTNIVLLAILGFIIYKFSISEVFESLLLGDEGQSRVNPYDAGRSEFNPWVGIIGIGAAILNRLSWQGSQAYYTSATSPHESKMAGVLGMFRHAMLFGIWTTIPIVAFMIMTSPDYAAEAEQVNQTIAQFENDQVRDQMLVPATMKLYLPAGLIGAFAAVMLLAFVSTHDTYLHSWGSILLQDVIIPLRKKPIDSRYHLLYLRLCVGAVAVFIFLFSCFFRQTQHIFYYFAITGAIWMGGAPIICFGALYTRWGSTAGAYAALIVGTTLGVAGIILEQVWKTLHNTNFPINGQYIYAIAIGAAAVVYVIFSLTGRRTHFNLDKLLHRGEYSIRSEHRVENAVSSTRNWNLKEALGITKDFTFGDKIIYAVYIGHQGFTIGACTVMTIYSFFIAEVTDVGWMKYHKFIFWYTIIFNAVGAIWIGIGGVRDYIRMHAALKVARRDDTDDGFVRDHDYAESAQ